MLHVGDKVVYPMHGAGIIDRIEDREILGEIKSYYILEIPYGRMQVMVPVDKCQEAGLRPVSEPSMIQDVLAVLSAPSTPMDANWNRRLRENSDKIKSGDPLQVAEVVRNLARIEREKKLSAGEKKLLSSAKQIISSEIVLIQGISDEDADAMIENAI